MRRKNPLFFAIFFISLCPLTNLFLNWQQDVCCRCQQAIFPLIEICKSDFISSSRRAGRKTNYTHEQACDGEALYMKRCCWCGKEQPDDASVCVVDGQPLQPTSVKEQDAHIETASRKPLQFDCPPWLEQVGLILMSLSAPLIAGCIQTSYHLLTGFRPRNAVISGLYFDDMGYFIQPKFWDVLLSWVVLFGVPGFLTLLVLLAFRRALYRWIIWICSIALWTYVFFRLE